jgi:uncharacterized protein YegL
MPGKIFGEEVMPKDQTTQSENESAVGEAAEQTVTGTDPVDAGSGIEQEPADEESGDGSNEEPGDVSVPDESYEEPGDVPAPAENEEEYADLEDSDQIEEAQPMGDAEASEEEPVESSRYSSIIRSKLMKMLATSVNIPDGAQLSYPNASAPGYDASQYPQDPNPGYVRMAKSAKWTDEANGLAEITFNLWGKPMSSASDIIIVLDVSDSTAFKSGTSTNEIQTIPQYFCPYDGVQLSGTPTWDPVVLNQTKRTVRLINAKNMDGSPHTHPDVITTRRGGGIASGAWYDNVPSLAPLNTVYSAQQGATNNFIDLAASNNGNRLGLVTFASNATVAASLGSSAQNMHDAVMNAGCAGETNYLAALQAAKGIIDSRTDKSRQPVILFVSDGIPNMPVGNINGYQSVANGLKAGGVKIYSVGINVLDTTALNYIQTDGMWNIGAGDLTAKFAEIANQMLASGTLAELTDLVNSQYFGVNGTPQVSQGTVTTNTGNPVKWNVGEIPGNSYATMTIPIKLKAGVTDNVLPTNTGAASLKYKNFNDKNCEILVDTPILFHPGTAIRLEYYLVNDNGEIVNNSGTVLDNLNNRVVIKPADFLDEGGNIISAAQPLTPGNIYQIQGFKEKFEYGGQWYQWVPASVSHGGHDYKDAIQANGVVTKYFGFKKIEPPEPDPDEDLTPKVPFTFTKVSASDSSPLPDAEFNLYVCSDEEHQGPGDHNYFDPATVNTAGSCWVPVDPDVTFIASDEHGTVDFGNIASGQYLLYESVAPNGYERPLGWWIISVDADNAHPITSITAAGPLSPPAFIADAGNTNLRLSNYRKSVLPLTGSLPQDLAVLTLLAVLLFIIAWLIFVVGRNRRATSAATSVSGGEWALSAKHMICIIRIAIAAILIFSFCFVETQASCYAADQDKGSITVHKYQSEGASLSGKRTGASAEQDVTKLPAESTPLPGINYTVRKVVVNPAPNKTDNVLYSDDDKSYIADESGVYAVHNASTNKNGEAVFSALPLGLYLVSEQGNQDLLLVDIPTTVPGATGPALYDVDVYPKPVDSSSSDDGDDQYPGDEITDDDAPANGQDVSPTENKDKIFSLPITGDNFPVVITIITMVIAGMILALLFLYRKRRPEKKHGRSSRAGP